MLTGSPPSTTCGVGHTSPKAKPTSATPNPNQIARVGEEALLAGGSSGPMPSPAFQRLAPCDSPSRRAGAYGRGGGPAMGASTGPCGGRASRGCWIRHSSRCAGSLLGCHCIDLASAPQSSAVPTRALEAALRTEKVAIRCCLPAIHMPMDLGRGWRAENLASVGAFALVQVQPETGSTSVRLSCSGAPPPRAPPQPATRAWLPSLPRYQREVARGATIVSTRSRSRDCLAHHQACQRNTDQRRNQRQPRQRAQHQVNQQRHTHRHQQRVEQPFEEQRYLQARQCLRRGRRIRSARCGVSRRLSGRQLCAECFGFRPASAHGLRLCRDCVRPLDAVTNARRLPVGCRRASIRIPSV